VNKSFTRDRFNGHLATGFYGSPVIKDYYASYLGGSENNVQTTMLKIAHLFDEIGDFVELVSSHT
jgi:hypothetical protein